MTALAHRRAFVVFSVVVAFTLLPHDVGAGSGGFVAGGTKPCAAAAKAAAAAGNGGKWGLAAITAAASGVDGEAFAATPSPAPCVELRPQTSLNRETIPIGGPPRLYALKDLKRDTSYEVRVSYPATNPANFTIELINPSPGMKLEQPPLGGDETRFDGGGGGHGGIAAGQGKMTTTGGSTSGGSAATNAGTSSFGSNPLSADATSAGGNANVKKKKKTAFFITPGQDGRNSNNKKKDSSSSSSAGGDLRRALRRLLNVEKLVMMENDVEEGTHADAGGGMGAAMVVRVTATPSGVHRDGPDGGPTHVVYNIALEPMVFGGLIPEIAVPVGALALACLWLAMALEPVLRKVVWGPLEEQRRGYHGNSSRKKS